MRGRNIENVAVLVLAFVVLGFSLFAIAKGVITGQNRLPEAAQRNLMVEEAYLFAMEHPELLEQVPCYCGCANVGHQSNKDCYLDGQGNFVEHGSLCGGCVGVTLDVKKLYLEGKSMKEIRSFIDEKHGSQEMAMSTPTPPVE